MPCLKPNRWLLPILLIVFTLSACTPQQGLDFAMLEPSMEAESNLLATVDVYHPDPSHLWNRVFAHFYVRIAPDGTAYGENGLEPLLWPESTYLLEGSSHRQALDLLDEFLTQDMEVWLDDPLKRAVMQRDLWAVFDWLTLADTFPEARQALQVRLAAAIGQLALSRAEIEALPDNYQLAVDSGAFPTGFDPDAPRAPFLPPDLLAANGAWVNLGREGGPMAISHLTQHPFLGRSTFLIFVHLPDKTGSIEDYIQSLQEAAQVERMPPFPTQLQVILLRQMLLIDEQGELVRTPLVESIQLRVGQMDAQFNLSRNHLFAGKSGGLRPLDGEEQGFPIFQTVGFEHFFEGQTEPSVSLPPVTLNQCTVCHRFGPHPISVNFSRFNFGMQSEERIVVRATSPEREAAFTIAWKEAHESWLRLQALPAASPPAIDSADGDGITVGIPELDALLPILLRDELPLEHIQFTSLPCTHQPGLGGPPKCEESEAEGTLIAVLPIMAQSGSYLRRSQIDGLILNVVRVDTVYRVANSTPWDGWPPGDYGIIAENADGFPPAITVFVADGKIVRLTYHMGKLLDTVRAEVTGEILYPADALPP